MIINKNVWPFYSGLNMLKRLWPLWVQWNGSLFNSLRPSDTYASVNQTITGANNGLSSGLCPAIISIKARLLLFGPLQMNFCDIQIEIQQFSFKNMDLKMSSTSSFYVTVKPLI